MIEELGIDGMVHSLSNQKLASLVGILTRGNRIKGLALKPLMRLPRVIAHFPPAVDIRSSG